MMAASPTLSDGSLPPIYKRTSRKWTKLPCTGTSVGINDPTLKQGYLGDLLKKSDIELEELIRRQDKLINDVNFIKKLRDGGERIRNRRQELQEALEALVANNVMPIPDVNSIEWQWRDTSKHVSSRYQGVVRNTTNTTHDEPLDSDDDEDPDPLELMATHSESLPYKPTESLNTSQKTTKVLPVDPADAIREELDKLNLFDENDERSLKNTVENESNIYTDLSKEFCNKLLINFEEKKDKNSAKKVFKPHRRYNQQEIFPKTVQNGATNELNSSGNSIKTDSSSDTSCRTEILSNSQSGLISQSKLPNHPAFGISATPVFTQPKKFNTSPNTWHKSPLWDCESAATGPLSFFGEACRTTKLLPMRESLELERKSHELRKKLQFEEAAARVARMSLRSNGQTTLSKATKLYHYKDLNDPSGYFLNNDGLYVADDVSHVISDNKPRYGNKEPSDDEGASTDEEGENNFGD